MVTIILVCFCFIFIEQDSPEKVALYGLKLFENQIITDYQTMSTEDFQEYYQLTTSNDFFAQKQCPVKTTLLVWSDSSSLFPLDAQYRADFYEKGKIIGSSWCSGIYVEGGFSYKDYSKVENWRFGEPEKYVSASNQNANSRVKVNSIRCYFFTGNSSISGESRKYERILGQDETLMKVLMEYFDDPLRETPDVYTTINFINDSNVRSFPFEAKVELWLLENRVEKDISKRQPSVWIKKYEEKFKIEPMSPNKYVYRRPSFVNLLKEYKKKRKQGINIESWKWIVKINGEVYEKEFLI